MFRKMVLSLTALLLPLTAFAVCSECDPQDKTYVQPEELIFDQSGIWLSKPAELELVAVDSVRRDAFGFYVEKKPQGVVQETSWKCPKCGRINQGPPYGSGCRKCSFPYDGDLK